MNELMRNSYPGVMASIAFFPEPGELKQTTYIKRRTGLVHSAEIDQFLGSIQNRALRIALASLQNRDDALDAVQDAMFKLVQKYSAKPASDWKPLFYRILYSRITDIQRKRTSTAKVFGSLFFGSQEEVPSVEDPIQSARDGRNPDPARGGYDHEFVVALDTALNAMPERQRQTFMLRAWEGMSVQETALALRCSQGSVKTHYSRARQHLQRRLAKFAEVEDLN